VPISRDLSSAIVFLALGGLLWGGAATGVGRLLGLFRATFAAPFGSSMATAALAARAFDVAMALVLPPVVVACAGALLVGALQTRGLFAWRAVATDVTRLSPAVGMARVFSPKTAGDIAQGVVKVFVVAAAAVVGVEALLRGLPALVGAAPGAVLAVLGLEARDLAIRGAMAFLALGILDGVLGHRRHRRSLLMTREEVKRDLKEAEGDLRHKAERQRLHRQLGERRLNEDVRSATAVVVNPEHIAVAIRYDRDGDQAPVVLAKGERLLAERIKQVAREAGVPIYRDVALARALHQLDEGEEIPQPLYESVAELLRMLWELERKPATSPAVAVTATVTDRPDGPPPASGGRRV